ncbi:MAG: divalent-cation tolerance protein CutA [Candidatus Kerfeldbacteria bacterium]
MITVYITCSKKKEAKEIAGALLKKRLVACTNIIPIDTMYWWNDEILEEDGFAIIGKTIDNKFADIEKEVKKHHSFAVPCITAWPIIHVSDDYSQWATGEIAIGKKE